MDRHSLSGLRFFSVDGRHTKALTCNDLEIADRSLDSHGICMLDDFMNAWWTGVMSGFFEFCRINRGLQPIALVPNKLVLARPHEVDACKALLRDRMGTILLQRDTERADGTVDFYGEFDRT